MKVKNAYVVEDDFFPAFAELINRDMPAKQCLEFSTCVDEMAAHINIVKRAKAAILDKYVARDKDKKPKADKQGNLLFDSDEIKEKCFKEIKEIMEESIDLPLTNRIIIYDDERSTPRKILLLKDIIEIVERKKKEST